MAVEALRCPTCAGADSSRSDANGIHTCVYCGVRYRITTAGPSTVDKSGARPGSRAVLLGVAVAAIAILGAVTSALLLRAPPPAVPSPVVPPLALSSPGVPSLAVPTPTLPAVPTAIEVSAPAPAAPEAPAKASFELHHRRPSSGSTFYLVGWVTNESPFAIDKPKVTAVLLDDAGKEVGTGFGYADDVAPAGARVATTVLLMNPPAHARIEFEVVARKASYIAEQATGLRLEHGAVGPATFGSGFRVQGKVHNDGVRPARFVNVRAHALDADGKLLGVSDTYADGEVLAAGGTARFELQMLPFEAEPAKFELFVQGSPAP